MLDPSVLEALVLGNSCSRNPFIHSRSIYVYTYKSNNT